MSKTKAKDDKDTTRSTLIINTELWKRFKMIAILNEMEISELVEQALREKLERMKALEQYPEYKDVQGLHVEKGTSHTMSQQQAQQSQHDEPVVHSARYEAAKSNGPITAQPQPQQLRRQEPNDRNRIAQVDKEMEELHAREKKYQHFDQVKLYLLGLKYPAHKNKIIETAKKNNKPNTELMFEGFSKIPARYYNNEKDVSNTLAKIYHDLVELSTDKLIERLRLSGDTKQAEMIQSRRSRTMVESIER